MTSVSALRRKGSLQKLPNFCRKSRWGEHSENPHLSDDDGVVKWGREGEGLPLPDVEPEGEHDVHTE